MREPRERPSLTGSTGYLENRHSRAHSHTVRRTLGLSRRGRSLLGHAHARTHARTGNPFAEMSEGFVFKRAAYMLRQNSLLFLQGGFRFTAHNEKRRENNPSIGLIEHSERKDEAVAP